MTQEMIVGLIVALAACYALWRWMPSAWRRAAAARLASGTQRAGLVDAERAQHIDEHALEPTHMGDDIDGLDEADDRISHELPGAVPGDLAAAIDVDHGSPVLWALLRFRPLSRGVHRLMLEEDQCIRTCTSDDIGVDTALKIPSVEVRYGRRSESRGEDLEHRRTAFLE